MLKCMYIYLIFENKACSSVVLDQLFVCFALPRKLIPHGNHYNSVMAQSLLTNQITLSAPQPISLGIAHVVWPQPTPTKRNKVCQNRLVLHGGSMTGLDVNLMLSEPL